MGRRVAAVADVSNSRTSSELGKHFNNENHFSFSTFRRNGLDGLAASQSKNIERAGTRFAGLNGQRDRPVPCEAN